MLMCPHWIASIKGVRPHLSLQSGSYWHLEPKPKIRAEKSHCFKPNGQLTPDHLQMTWPTNDLWKSTALSLFSPSQYQNLALQQYVNFPQQICFSSNFCHSILWTVISPTSHARALKSPLSLHNWSIIKTSQFCIQKFLSFSLSLLSSLRTESIDNSLLTLASAFLIHSHSYQNNLFTMQIGCGCSC